MSRIRFLSEQPERLADARVLVEEYIRLPDAWVHLGGPPGRLPRLAATLERLPHPAVPPAGDIAIAIDEAAQPIGVGLLVPYDNGTAELKHVYVRPQHQRSGIGSSLVTALLEQARQFGYRVAILDVMASRHNAMRLYQRLGFAPIPLYHDHHGFDMRAYQKNL